MTVNVVTDADWGHRTDYLSGAPVLLVSLLGRDCQLREHVKRGFVSFMAGVCGEYEGKENL